MYDLLDIVLAVIVYLSPQDVKAIQVWPFANETNKNELTLTYRKQGDRWCSVYGCVRVVDGKLLDEHGKVLLEIKNHLTITNGTNCVLTQPQWEAPQKFSLRTEAGERLIAFDNGTNSAREFRIKLWQTDPPVEFAFCRPQQTNELAVLWQELRAQKFSCTEIRSAPKGISFGFSIDPKEFKRARTAAIKVIQAKSLSLNLELDANSNGDEFWVKGKKTGEKHF